MSSHESDFRLPERVGLCPHHGGEFYVPHGGRCPAAGCMFDLVIYERVDPRVIKEARDAIARSRAVTDQAAAGLRDRGVK